MLVNAKCAPHYVRVLTDKDPSSPFLKSYAGGAGGCPAGTHYLGIRPNGDVTPCPYLPLFGGNLTQASLRDIWADLGPVRAHPPAHRRSGGRCGACELNPACGGCRARAFGMTGDVMAEDPLCTHTPGHPASADARAVEYGTPASGTLPWDAGATRAPEADSGLRARHGQPPGGGLLPRAGPAARHRRRHGGDPGEDAEAEGVRARLSACRSSDHVAAGFSPPP